MEISNEDLELIRKFEDISRRGYYCDGKQVTDLHNKVLGTRLASTNCGSCIKIRIAALVEAANKFERMIAKDTISSPIEALSNNEQTGNNTGENNELTEAEKMKERMAKVRAAKLNKK